MTPGIRVELVEPDPSWPVTAAAELDAIRAALGPVVVSAEHAGSTSVPGLAAKPVIDLLLVVADPDDETAYTGGLEGCGFRFVLREPDWHRHRLFKKGPLLHEPAPPGTLRVNLHVFAEGEEPHRMRVFRDRLRTHEADRLLYERTKRELATRDWDEVQDYADAKTDVVTEILQRALRDS